MDTHALETLYEVANDRPGWHAKLENNCGLSREQMNYIEWLHRANNRVRESLKQWEAQIDEDGGIELAAAESDEQKVGVLSEAIASVEETYQKLARAGVPYLERALALESAGYEKLLKARERYARSLRTGLFRDVSDQDIERARSVPLEKVIDVPRTNRVRCMFHDDKRPSMFVKNGFGYCFSCGAWCDSIKYMMHSGKSFLDAVRILVGRA